MTYICFCENTDFLECNDNSGQNKTSIVKNEHNNASNANNKTSNCTCKGFTEVLLLLLISLTAVVVIVILFHVFLKKFKACLTLRQKRQLWMKTYSANPRKYTVFLAFCSDNDNFVMKYVYPNLNSGIQKGLRTDSRCVLTGIQMGLRTDEPRYEKTRLLGFRPGLTQTRLYNHSRWLAA